MQTFVGWLAQSGAPVVLVGIGLLALGALECFLGYKIFRVQMGIVCFLAGFGVGATAVMRVFGNWIAALIVGLVVGAGLCVLSFAIFKLGVFLFIGFFAFCASYVWLDIVWQHGFWLALIIGVVAGLVGAFAAKPVIILSTAVGGAGIAAQGLAVLFGPLQNTLWALFFCAALAVVMTVAGIVTQFKTNKDKPLEPPRKRSAA